MKFVIFFSVVAEVLLLLQLASILLEKKTQAVHMIRITMKF